MCVLRARARNRVSSSPTSGRPFPSGVKVHASSSASTIVSIIFFTPGIPQAIDPKTSNLLKTTNETWTGTVGGDLGAHFGWKADYNDQKQAYDGRPSQDSALGRFTLLYNVNVELQLRTSVGNERNNYSGVVQTD